MDPINPIAGNPESVNQNFRPVEVKQSNSLTVISVALFILMSLGVIAFLYYQNQQLKGMLANYQATPAPTSSTTALATADPTANWKTYTNTSANYSIKYPIDWKIENYGLMDPKPALPDTKNVHLFFQPDPSRVAVELNIEEVSSISADIQAKSKEVKSIGTDQSSKCWTTDDTMTSFCWLKVPNASKYLNFIISNYKNSGDKTTIDRILSTFKFTSASPSPMPKTTPVSTSSGIPSGY